MSRGSSISNENNSAKALIHQTTASKKLDAMKSDVREEAIFNKLSKKEQDGEALLTLLRELRPVSFHYKKSAESKYSRFGFIAQEIEKVLPNMVHTDSEGMKSLYQNDLVAVLTLGLQSLDQRLLRIDGKISTLKEKIDVNYLTLSDRLKTIEAVVRKVVEAKKIAKIKAGNRPIASDAPATKLAGL